MRDLLSLKAIWDKFLGLVSTLDVFFCFKDLLFPKAIEKHYDNTKQRSFFLYYMIMKMKKRSTVRTNTARGNLTSILMYNKLYIFKELDHWKEKLKKKDESR